jgi:hypothetical protein
MDILLDKRLPTGDLDIPAAIRADLRKNVLNLHSGAFIERVLGIAVTAPDVAIRKPHEHAGKPHEARFPLYTVEDLVDEERAGGGLFDVGFHWFSTEISETVVLFATIRAKPQL